jgi:hypothetical protein
MRRIEGITGETTRLEEEKNRVNGKIKDEKTIRTVGK